MKEYEKDAYTTWGRADDQVETRNGFISNRQWSEAEAARLTKAGKPARIISRLYTFSDRKEKVEFICAGKA